MGEGMLYVCYPHLKKSTLECVNESIITLYQLLRTTFRIDIRPPPDPVSTVMLLTSRRVGHLYFTSRVYVYTLACFDSTLQICNA